MTSATWSPRPAPISVEVGLTALRAPELLHTAVIEGTEGRIEIPRFWRARRTVLYRGARRAATAEFPFLANGYEYQAMEVERLLRRGELESPRLPHAESIALLELMDEVRRRMGVRYPFESVTGVTGDRGRAWPTGEAREAGR